MSQDNVPEIISDDNIDNNDDHSINEDEIVDLEVQGPNNESAVNGNQENQPDHPTTRSGRTVKMPTKFDDYYVYHNSIIMDLEDEAHSASYDPDVTYINEAMRQPDRDKFLKAMEEEIRAHTENRNWTLITRDKVPNNQPILPAVWAMRSK
jgi:hypothetical protein